LIKRAQWVSSESLYGKTLYDLYREIRNDQGLSEFERQRLVAQIEGVTQGAAPSTPLAILMARGLGGVVGWLIAKYFSLGPVGRAVTTLVGVGLGKQVYDQFNQPPDPNPGWKMLR